MAALSATRSSLAPDFEEGSLVLLNAQHVATTRPTKKLDDKFIGPFRIVKRTGPVNYRLNIPGCQIHNVFHVNCLRPYADPASFPGRPNFSRPAPALAETNEYKVLAIVDS